MPVRKLRISFDIEMPVLMAALVDGHTAMNIDAFQNAVGDPGVVSVSHTKPKLLTDRGGLKRLLLRALQDNGKMKVSDLRLIIVGAGYSANSVHSQIFDMRQEKLIRRMGKGFYAIAKKGHEYVRA